MNLMRPGLHWKTPTVSIASLIVGALFAIGHHVFYSRLDGRQTADKSLLDQSTNIEIGTLCSHVVRASFAIAMSAAYWQLFWQNAKSRPISIGAIDSLAGILTGAQNFFTWSAITSGPHLVAFALFAWLVPWAMIVPPGTLSVTVAMTPAESQELLQVPAFENASYLNSFARAKFNTTNPAVMAAAGRNDSGSYARYLGYSHALFQTAMGAAFSGDIPTIEPPHVNSSYTLEYHAPAVKCQNTSVEILDEFQPALDSSNSGNGMYAGITLCAGHNGCHAFLYLGWVPGWAEVPFLNGSIRDGRLPSLGKLGPASENDTAGPARFYVATNLDDPLDWNVLNCSLHKASYSASFNFTDGHQNVAIINRTLLQPISAHTDSIFNYSDVDAVQWMYQAVMELMGQLISGAISYVVEGPDLTSRNPVAIAIDDLQIIYTNVALSREVAYIVGPHYFTEAIFNVTSTNASLSDTLEALMADLSLSLFSREEFLTPLEKPTRVKTLSYDNVYAYNWQRLWLAYGTAAACTACAVAIAFVAMLRHGATYSNSYSTLLRTAFGQKLEGVLSEGDEGEDPLPKRIAVAEISLGGKRTVLSGSQEALNAQLPQSRADMEMNLLNGRAGGDRDDEAGR